jgi:hypothetical protein
LEFKKALELHLEAMKAKDLDGLKKSIPEEGNLTVILSDGAVIETVEEYLQFNSEWFKEGDWSLGYDVVFMEETAEMAYGIIEANYFDKDENGEPFHLDLLMSMTFRLVEGKWLMVFSQHTEGVDEDED